jgi:hypothetical protein
VSYPESAGRERGSPVFRAVLFGLLGAGLLAFGGFLLWEAISALRSGSWPTVEGTVQTSRVLEEVRTRGGTQYRVELTYTYAVEGKVYTGDRFNNRNNYLAGEDRARAVARAYPPGAKVPVSYNPGDPAQAVLEPEVTWHTWGRLVIGVVLLLVGPWLLYLGWQELRPRRPRGT